MEDFTKFMFEIGLIMRIGEQRNYVNIDDIDFFEEEKEEYYDNWRDEENYEENEGN